MDLIKSRNEWLFSNSWMSQNYVPWWRLVGLTHDVPTVHCLQDHSKVFTGQAKRNEHYLIKMCVWVADNIATANVFLCATRYKNHIYTLFITYTIEYTRTFVHYLFCKNGIHFYLEK